MAKTKMVTCANKDCTKTNRKFDESLAIEVTNKGSKKRKFVCCENCKDEYFNSKEYQLERLKDYLWIVILDRPKITGLGEHLFKQVNDFITKSKLNPEGMYYTLKYFNEILGKEWNYDYYLGQIFPRYYWETQQYMAQNIDIEDAIEDLQEDETVIITKKKITKNNFVKQNINFD